MCTHRIGSNNKNIVTCIITIILLLLLYGLSQQVKLYVHTADAFRAPVP